MILRVINPERDNIGRADQPFVQFRHGLLLLHSLTFSAYAAKKQVWSYL